MIVEVFFAKKALNKHKDETSAHQTHSDGKTNKKLTVLTEHGNVVYCVLSPEADHKKQLEELLGIQRGRGHCVEFDEKTVKVIDCFHAETITTFEVLSFTDCEDAVILKWQKQ